MSYLDATQARRRQDEFAAQLGQGEPPTASPGGAITCRVIGPAGGGQKVYEAYLTQIDAADYQGGPVIVIQDMTEKILVANIGTGNPVGKDFVAEEFDNGTLIIEA